MLQLQPLKQVVNKLYAGSGRTNETASEQALVSYINNTNIPNISNDLKIVNLGEQAKKYKNDNDFLKIKTAEEMPFAFADTDKNQTDSGRQKEKSFAKKEKELTPTIKNVKAYFLEHNFQEIEAVKFFNYFSNNGWLVGGKTPMGD